MTYRWSLTLRSMAVVLASLVVIHPSTNRLAQADLVTFRFEGVVDGVTRPLALPIIPHTPFSASHRFNFADFDHSPVNPAVVNYPLTNLSLDVEGPHASIPTDNRVIPLTVSFSSDGLIHDRYIVESNKGGGTDSMGGMPSIALHVDLLKSGSELFRDDSLPLTPPSLQGLDTNVVRMFFFKGLIDEPDHSMIDVGLTQAHGHLTSLSLAPVPLPGAVLVFASSLIGLASLGLRRRVAPRVGRNPEPDRS